MREAWSRWPLDPAALVALSLLAAGYWRGVARTRRAGATGPLPLRRVALFGLGWATLAVALVSPLDPAGDVLLSAHMAQHVLLVTAPLALGGGRTLTAVLLGIDPALRAQVSRPLHRLGRSLVPSRPVAAGLLVLATAVWHVPGAYQAALVSPALHTLEHVTYLAAGAMFWASVLGWGRRGALEPAASLATLGVVSLVGTAVGALLTFSTRPWYPRYVTTTRSLGVDWLADQQLAGLVMWIPLGLVVVAVFLRLAASMLVEVERRTAGAGRGP